MKSMISSMPVYNMPALQLPNKTLNTFNKMMINFWWGDGVDKNKKLTYTIKWNELCKPIVDGGLGIRKFKENDLALLAKTTWRCVFNEYLLYTKIIVPKYCPN